MLLRDRITLLALTAAWGLNFSIIKAALAELPPLLLGTLRFALVAFPAVLLLPRPTVPIRAIALYGAAMFAVQFSLLFAGMAQGVDAGVASLLLQVQVFFTIALALVDAREVPGRRQVLGTALGALGLWILLLTSPSPAPASGLLLVLLAGLSWAIANTLSRRLLSGQAALPLVAWGSLVSVPPVALASLWFEGWSTWIQVLGDSRPRTWAAVGYISYVSTLAGFAVWARQLRRYPAASVAPFSMLVPIFGLALAAPLVGEEMTALKAMAASLVLAGVATSQWNGTVRFRIRKGRSRS